MGCFPQRRADCAVGLPSYNEGITVAMAEEQGGKDAVQDACLWGNKPLNGYVKDGVVCMKGYRVIFFAMALVGMWALLIAGGCQLATQRQRVVDDSCYGPESFPSKKEACSSEVCANDDGICYTDGDMVRTNLFQVKRCAPACGAVDEEIPIDIEVTALHDVSEVVVRDVFSRHVNILRASPAANIDSQDNEVVWTIDCLNECECKQLRVWVTSEIAGDICDCVTVCGLPRLCGTTFIGKCDLDVEGCGPEKMCLDECGYYTVEITNNGSALARDVMATCFVPRGMDHQSGDSELSWRLGDIPERCNETITFSLVAVEAGNQNIVVKAVASNHCEISKTVRTSVVQPRFALTCEAIKEQFIGRNTEVAITVTNTCSVDLSNVVITDGISPYDVTVVRAAEGTICDNQVVWKIPELKTGHSHIVNVVVCCDCPCEVSHSLHATACSDCCPPCDASNGCCTVYKGHPGLLIEMVDTCDPMLVGETGTYRIRVTNQGTADDEDVRVVATFPSELEPVCARGSTEGHITGQTVNFDAHSRLGPGKSLEYAIEAKAKGKGDARLKVELHSALLTEPVTEEESTYIY